ncbi:MAG: xanthine dehydrogenase family protein subunit M [Deltaproteobacteria bacterium]|nr:xanthine dehydrogenase family protein subunit M [Deltaproteobacteria bacterium]
MSSFRHVNARTVEEACALLEAHGPKARLNAGGTDLLGAVRDGIVLEPPELLVNLKTIPGLDGIRDEGGGLVLGALTRLSRLQEAPVVREKYLLVAEAARSVGTPQLRNMGTLGGNLCQEVRCWYYRYPNHVGGAISCLRKGKGPCLAVKGDSRYHAILGGKGCFAASPSDLATALVALDAVLRVRGSGGEREIPLRDFYTPLGTVLAPAEVVTEVRIPALAAGARQTFLKFTVRKPVDFALVSVAAVLRAEGGVCAEARLALGAVSPVPVRAVAAEEALVGKPLDEASAELAAAAAVAKARPLAQSAYKVEITKALVKRAVWSEAEGPCAQSLPEGVAQGGDVCAGSRG